MNDAGRDFLKIVPSLRKYSMRIIEKNPIYGESVTIPGRECGIEAYVHKASNDRSPVLFEFHGGGFILGDAAKDDNLCERIRKEADITVIGVNYRKAPEHPYPAAWQDAYDVIKYVHDEPDRFGIDPGKMAVMGFSSGANLATVVAMKAAETGVFSLKCQILHYPYVDGASSPASKPQHPADLPVEVMEAFGETYNNGEDPKKADISPLYATSDELRGSAPAALFMAAEDALMPEGFAYAERLRRAGVEVICAEAVEDMHHGYMEDYFNKPLYDSQPESTKVLHSLRMAEKAESVLMKTEEILKDRLK